MNELSSELCYVTTKSMSCVATLLVLSIFASLPQSTSSQMTLNTKTNNIASQYVPCSTGCSSCSATNGCVKCQAGYFLHFRRQGSRQTGDCVTSCPSGYYGVVKTFSMCHECTQSHCVTCQNNTQCTACRQPYFVYDGKCVLQCPHGLHYDIVSKNCLPEVDCQLSAWSTWQFCNKKGQICGYKYGTQKRSRSIVQLPSDGGQHCPANTRQTRRCKMTYRHCDGLGQGRMTTNGTLGDVGAVQISLERGLSSVKVLRRKGGEKRHQWRHKQARLDTQGRVDVRMRRKQKRKLAHLVPL